MDGYAATWRLYHYDQGRWISPDPAGLSAVDPSNPQTWNRYAYVAGNPLGNVDPSGLLAYCPYGVNYNTSPPSCLPPPTSPCYSAATGAAPPGCGGGAPANSGYGAPGGQGGTAGGGSTAPNNGQQKVSNQIAAVNNCTSQANAAMNAGPSVAPTTQNIIDGIVAATYTVASGGATSVWSVVGNFFKGASIRSVGHAAQNGLTFLTSYHGCLTASGQGSPYNPYSPE